MCRNRAASERHSLCVGCSRHAEQGRLLCADCTEMATELVQTRWSAELVASNKRAAEPLQRVVSVPSAAERYREAKKAYLASGLLADKLAMEAAMESMSEEGLDRITDANMDHYVPAPPPKKRTFNGVLAAFLVVIGVVEATVLHAPWWDMAILAPGFLLNVAGWQRWWPLR